MKKFILVILLLPIFFVSCVQQVEITDDEKKYIFMSSDIKGFNQKHYSIKPQKNGSEYFFCKSFDKNNGYYLLYSINLTNGTGDDIKVKTTLSILKSNSKAKSLFESSIKTLKLIYKSNIIDILPNEYNAEQVFMINTNDFFSLILQSGIYFYEVDIEGTKIDIDQVKDGIITKFNIAKDVFIELN